jgi:hypothetical protein
MRLPAGSKVLKGAMREREGQTGWGSVKSESVMVVVVVAVAGRCEPTSSNQAADQEIAL